MSDTGRILSTEGTKLALLLGAQQVSFLHIVFTLSSFGYTDGISLEVPIRRYDMSRFLQSLLERWDCFELGNWKLKGVRDKETSNWQLKLWGWAKYPSFLSQRKALTLTQNYVVYHTWQVKRKRWQLCQPTPVPLQAHCLLFIDEEGLFLFCPLWLGFAIWAHFQINWWTTLPTNEYSNLTGRFIENYIPYKAPGPYLN